MRKFINLDIKFLRSTYPGGDILYMYNTLLRNSTTQPTILCQRKKCFSESAHHKKLNGK